MNFKSFVTNLNFYDTNSVSKDIQSLNNLDVKELLSYQNLRILITAPSKAKFIIKECYSYHPQAFIDCATLPFWETFAKLSHIEKDIDIICSKYSNEIFNIEKLQLLTQSKIFRDKIFVLLPYNIQQNFTQSMIDKLQISTTFENNFEILKDLLPYIYSPTGAKSSMINNSPITREKGDVWTSEFQGYKDLINNEKNTISVSHLFNNPKLKHLFLNDFSLLSGLSREDRTDLYSSLSFDKLSDLENQNVIKLLSNGYLTNYNDTFLKNEKFVNYMVKNTSTTEFKKLIMTLNFTNPEISKKIISAKDKYLDSLLWQEDKINKTNYPIVSYENGEEDTFVNSIFYRYFKTFPNDVCLSAQLIADSIASLPRLGDKISSEGKNLILALSNIVDSRKGKSIDNFTFSKLNFLKDPKLILQLKQAAENYIEVHGDINLEKLVDACKNEFANNLSNNLTNKNSNDVTTRIINGTTVHDLTNCDSFYMLVHATTSPEIPTINPDNEQLLSMSLLDNNHLCTFRDDYVFGYNNISDESLIHAYCDDSATTKGVGSAKLLMYQRITNIAPIYTDLESFMNATEQVQHAGDYYYNELKIKATPNSQNNRGEAIMKPSYILYKADNINTIPKHIIETAEKYSLDIFIVDTAKVKNKTYAPIIDKTKIMHGSYQY